MVQPWIKVEVRNDLWRLEDADDLLSDNPDWVVGKLSGALSLSPCFHFMLIMRGRLHRQHPDKSAPAHTEVLRMIQD